MVLLLSITDIVIFTQADESKTRQISAGEQKAVKRSSPRESLANLLQPLKYALVRNVLLLSVLLEGWPHAFDYQKPMNPEVKHVFSQAVQFLKERV